MITWQKITPPEAFRRIRRGANTCTMLHTGFAAVKRVVGRNLPEHEHLTPEGTVRENRLEPESKLS